MSCFGLRHGSDSIPDSLMDGETEVVDINKSCPEQAWTTEMKRSEKATRSGIIREPRINILNF
jgi:hypothetical protein